ncbi:hypothetical protein ACFLQ2_01890 [archaeon]
MALELPSLPKSVVFNSSVIAAIAMSALIAIIFLWQFTPMLMGTLVAPEDSKKELSVDFYYLRQATPGLPWQVNGTATNPGNETLTNINLRIFSDSNIDGADYDIASLAGGATANFTIDAKIRASAFEGKFTAQAIVSVEGQAPTEYAIPVSISR